MPTIGSFSGGSARGFGFGRVKAASVLTGGTLYSDATHNYRAFIASGSFVVSGVPLEAEILMIGGGGNSLSTYPSAGGGAGQVTSYNNTLAIGSYTCTIGSAGSSSTVSVIDRTAVGGGSGNSGTGGTSGNGFAGGNNSSGATPAGGGGGATAVGSNGYQHPIYSNNQAGSGGAGTSAYSSFGSATGIGVLSGGLYYYGGGGGGQGGAQASGANPGGGGLGGGGNGSFYAFWDGVNQTNNTYANHLNNQGPANCGGGAGGFYNNQTNGNSGLIVFKYLKSAGS